MMVKYILVVFAFLINFNLSVQAHAQTDVYLEIYTKTFQRMELDLYPFTSEHRGTDAEIIAGLITEVLKNDLWMSGYFTVNLRYDPAPGNGVANAQKQSNAFANVRGGFTFENNVVIVRPEIVDKASGGTILRADYQEASGQERRTLHRIADDIVYTLTGEKGIANSKVAFVHETQRGEKEIAIMDYDGHNSLVLTNDKSINLSPTWSPDGHKICYTSYKNGNPDFFVYNLRTNREIRVSNIKGINSAPAWSPDGQKIALTLSKDGNAEIYTLNVETKKFDRLTYNRAIDSSPSWSPSNREIAFTSGRSGGPQVYVMDSDGLNIRRLTYEGSYNDSPAWSPKGDKIAYVSRTDSGFDIYTIDVTGENIMRLTDSSGSNEDPCWSPNGFSMIFSSNRSGKRALYSMFWDGTDQKKLTNVGTSYLPSWSAR